MDCSCDASAIGCDSVVTLYQKYDRRALKYHRCNECRRAIKKNETYTIEKFRDDERFHTYKTCNDCQSVRQVFFSKGYYFEALWADMGSFIHDAKGQIPEDCIAQLTPAARNKVCDLIEETLVFWSKHSPH